MALLPFINLILVIPFTCSMHVLTAVCQSCPAVTLPYCTTYRWDCNDEKWRNSCGEDGMVILRRLLQDIQLKLDAFCFLPNGNRTHRKVPVRICSITEPVEQQSDRLGSIDFWLGFVRLTTPDFCKEASATPRVEKGYLHCSADVTNLTLRLRHGVSAECR